MAAVPWEFNTRGKFNRIRPSGAWNSAGLIGMISDRDLQRAHGQGWDMQRAVDHSMTYDAQVIETSAPVSDAARTFLDKGIGALVVVEGDELVGMLSIADILSHCADLID